jgi:hypothetical protein
MLPFGLEAQRAAVEAFARQRGEAIVGSYIEVETGKRADRPELAKALCVAPVIREVQKSGATALAVIARTLG